MSKLKVIEFGKGAVREVDLPDAPYRPLVSETPEQEEIRELRDRLAIRQEVIRRQEWTIHRQEAQLETDDRQMRLQLALLLVESVWILIATITRWL